MPRTKGSKKGIILVSQQEADRRYYLKNKKKILIRIKKYEAKNKNKIKKRKQQWWIKKSYPQFNLTMIEL